MEKKEILKYLEDGIFCIMIPVYYECEEKPAWRKVCIGSKEYCESRFNDYPNFYNATAEENREMRECRFREYLFLKEIGKRKKDMLEIQKAYGF